MIFNTLLQIAAFDAIPTDDIYEAITGGIDFGEAINANFDTLGFESTFIIVNLGSLGLVIMVVYPMLYVLFYLMSFFSCFKFMRKWRIKLGKILFWGATLRLFIESFMIAFLAGIINLKNLNFDTDASWEFANTVLSIVFLVLYSLFPIISTQYLRRHFNLLTNKRFNEKYGELYAGLNITRINVVHHVRLDYFRKVVICISVVFYQEGLWAQILICIMMSVFLIISAGTLNPSLSRADMYMERFNETRLIIIVYHIMCFTDFIPDSETRFNVGFSCIAIIMGGLLINSIKLISEPIYLLRRRIKLYFYKKAEKKQRKMKRVDTKNFNARVLIKYQTE